MLQDFENKGLRITCDEVSSLTLLVTEKQKAKNLNIQKISKNSLKFLKIPKSFNLRRVADKSPIMFQIIWKPSVVKELHFRDITSKVMRGEKTERTD